MSTLIENASYIVTCNDRDDILKDCDIFIEGGVIKKIGKNLLKDSDIVPDDDVQITDASHHIVYPGLINTHHHLYQTFSRNLKEVQNMELFDWLKYLYEIWKNLDADTVYYSSLTGMADLLKTGCTTCLDHHYVFPEGETSKTLLGAQFEAADLLGMRFHATRGSMDLSVKDGGLPPDCVTQSVDEILRDSSDAVEEFNDPERFAMHRVALAPCSPFSVSRQLLVESVRLARNLHVRLHTHVAETLDEEKYTLEKYNLRPLEYMESVGFIGDDTWYAHGIHFNDDEIKRLAQTGTGIAHCPISNMKLASGVCRVPEMLENGVKMGLAVDGSASNDGSSLMEEMRVCYLLHRLCESKRAPGGYDILKMATRGSAGLLGRDDIGELAEEKAADLFMIDVNKPELTGATFDPGSMLATVGFHNTVSLTMVNGRIVVKDGKLTGTDEERLAEKAQEVNRNYLGKKIS